jgi:hypothetical protein
MFKSSNSKAVVPSRGTAVANAQPEPSALAIINPASLPEPVKKGLMGLIVGFIPPGMGGMSDEDRAIYLDGYKMAVEGFELAVVEYVTKYLRLHNPRNTEKFTQPPTAQDVHETCKRVRRQWKHRCLKHFTGVDTLSYEKLLRGGLLPWGPEPLQPGCFVHAELAVKFLREEIASGDGDSEYEQSYGKALLSMDESKFNRIPAEVFDDGVREKLIAARKAKRAQAEYEAGLSYDERRARSHVLHEMRCSYRYLPGRGESPTEEEIRRATQDYLKWTAEREAEEDKRREEKFGAKPINNTASVIGNLLQPMDEVVDDGRQFNLEESSESPED